MSFLTGLAASILEWFLTGLYNFFKELFTQKQANDTADQKGKDDAQALKDAKTDQELEDAAKKINSGLTGK